MKRCLFILLLLLLCSLYTKDSSLLADSPFAGACNLVPKFEDSSVEELHRTIVTSSYWEEADIDLICRVVEAEAGNQSHLGKALVCDVILNRADCWSLSISEVVYQENAFDGVNYLDWYSKETREIVEGELINRTNCDILYFRTTDYHSFGVPVFKEGDHYFSK